MNEEKKPEIKFDPVIYWAPASDYQIGNWVEEKRGGDGRVIQAEQPMRFSDCLYIATSEKECTFIEATTAFSNKTIKRCKDMAEARSLSSTRHMKKSVTEYSGEVTVAKTFDANNAVSSIRNEVISTTNNIG